MSNPAVVQQGEQICHILDEPSGQILGRFMSLKDTLACVDIITMGDEKQLEGLTIVCAASELVKPRATCALSADQQWLATLTPASIWIVSRWHSIDCLWVRQNPAIPDTGQDANDVLAQFLNEKGQTP